MSSNLENEDLENIPLVRMEDVQPARDRNCDVYYVEVENGLETWVVDDLEYDNEYIVDNDDDSNIGSMVSVHSEEVREDSDDVEFIVPDVIEDKHKDKQIIEEKKQQIWPTLEILPGGVIKHSEKCDEDLSVLYPDENEMCSDMNSENMYACAKCSQSFKFLVSLVKHVRWHEIEQKRQQAVPKLDHQEAKYICLNSVKSKVITKTRKRKVPMILKKTKS